MAPRSIRTDRLVLRRWKDSDLEPFAEINSDPVVMEFLPRPLTRSESDSFVERIESTFEDHGFGLWALEVPGFAGLAGFVGLWPATFEAPFTPAVEVGWRLARPAWGHGFATEGARASVEDGFTRLDLPEIVSFTAAHNHRSRAVMERLGMTTDPGEDFDHPSLGVGHALRRHVLYRVRQG